MPIVQSTVTSITQAPSSPRSSSQGRNNVPPNDVLTGFVPMFLTNGCTEEGCTIESDDPQLTNSVRRHFLEHFGRRDLDGIVSDYSPDAIMINVVNGKRTKYHGHEEIREAFQGIFALHPTTDSVFRLLNIEVDHKHAIAMWTATTPTRNFPQSMDSFVFDTHGKIIKQYFCCQMDEMEHPWYVG